MAIIKNETLKLMVDGWNKGKITKWMNVIRSVIIWFVVHQPKQWLNAEQATPSTWMILFTGNGFMPNIWTLSNQNLRAKNVIVSVERWPSVYFFAKFHNFGKISSQSWDTIFFAPVNIFWNLQRKKFSDGWLPDIWSIVLIWQKGNIKTWPLHNEQSVPLKSRYQALGF